MTLDLSFLLDPNHDIQSYVQRWKAMGEDHTDTHYYDSAKLRFIWFSEKGSTDALSTLGLYIAVTPNLHSEWLLNVCPGNFHRKKFPLNAVPMESPFKKKELAQRWREFISLFLPVEVENITQIYAYDE